jgi:hypothetical protein
MAGPLGGNAGDLGAPPLPLKHVDGGAPGGAVGDPGAPTINAKNIDGRPRGPHGGAFGLNPGSEICVVNLHGYERQKIILLTGLTFPAPGPAMAYDP